MQRKDLLFAILLLSQATPLRAMEDERFSNSPHPVIQISSPVASINLEEQKAKILFLINLKYYIIQKQ